MALLRDIVSKLNIIWRSRYDFTSFWIPRCNDVVTLISQVVPLPKNTAEIGVETRSKRYIDIPEKCRRPLEVYTFSESDYPFDIVDNSIKLRDDFEKYDHSGTSVNLTWVSTTQVTVNTAVVADFSNTLLVDSAGKTFVIERASGLDLTLLHAATTTPETTTGYIVPQDSYLLLKCIANYDKVTSESSEVPLSDKFEKAISTGLMMEIMKDIGDLSQVGNWLTLMKWELGLLELDSGKLNELKTKLGVNGAQSPA